VAGSAAKDVAEEAKIFPKPWENAKKNPKKWAFS